ncbi:MAG TPA: hypothetical protein VGB70_09915 [Allosphingosinicella sp.]|jgi:hypothetical protein
MEYQRRTTPRILNNDAVAAVWPTAAVESMTASAAEAPAEETPFAMTPAMADVATGVAGLVVGTYAALIVVFFALFANSPVAVFAITVCAFFVAMFFAVPRIFLKVEAAPVRRPSFDRFMRTGIETLTGRTGGGDALLQMLIVPVLLTLGLAAMGIIGKIYIG